jgi:hypothetical protein
MNAPFSQAFKRPDYVVSACCAPIAMHLQSTHPYLISVGGQSGQIPL